MMLIEKMAKAHWAASAGLGSLSWDDLDADRKRGLIKSMVKTMFVAECASDEDLPNIKDDAVSKGKCEWIFRRICGLLRKEAAVSLATMGNSSGRWELPGKH